MGKPTTAKYPIYLTVPVPLDMGWHLYALADVYGRDRNAILRAVIEAGLAALSPSYKEQTCREVLSGAGRASWPQ